MEEKTEGKQDPGWNDPPLFTYDKATEIQASVHKKGRLLNKRVAYPIGGKPGNAGTSPVAPMPGVSDSPQMKIPPQGSFPPPVQGVAWSKTVENENEGLSKNEKLEKVRKNLETLVPENDEEISKRIKLLETMWTEGKLDDQVQLRLIDLTEALNKGDIESADHLQKGLMVDYVSQCSTWMSGIRQLINYKRNPKGL